MKLTTEGALLVDESGIVMAQMCRGSRGAREIALAVNTHDALVAAIRSAIVALRRPAPPIMRDVREQLEKAIDAMNDEARALWDAKEGE